MTDTRIDTGTKIDTNKLIGGLSAVILLLGGIVWQNLNSSISNLGAELSNLTGELKETNRTIGQMKEDLAVVRTRIEYVSPRPQKMEWEHTPSSTGTSSPTAKPETTGTSSGRNDQK